ncbi:MAG TPA: nuclear transport factor 2 family protein [Woeseiaceae bacterium]|jgi:ketosteroid isomerase-like protein|nr:nuclear transport factor 2 family protein [Woeseiaceae bacterium]
MKNLVVCLTILLLPLGAYAGDESSAEAEVRAAAADFNDAYATNDLDRYFSYYAKDAVVYWYGERQDLGAYYKEWKELIESGGGVEKNELSREIFQVVPGGKAVIASYFVHNVTKLADGEVSEAGYYESEVWAKKDGEWKVVNLHYSEL